MIRSTGGWKPRWSLWISLTLLFFVSPGCRLLGNLRDRTGARISFLSWNIRSVVTTPVEAKRSRAFQIASLSNRELDDLMKCKPAPDLQSLVGSWKGINKGLGAALLGLTQDVKSFQTHGECVRGHNTMVYQIPIRDLPCRGWRLIRDPTTCKPKTMGKFIAVQECDSDTHKLVTRLDYTQASNPFYDPSRFLIDELVVIDDDLLLGRANAKIGLVEIPVAYFVLFR